MSFLEILSRLFYIGLGAFMGVCAYYICPLQSDVGSGWSDWLIFVFMVICCVVLVWYGLNLIRAEESQAENDYREELKDLNKTPLRKKIESWFSAVFFFALGGFLLYGGVDSLEDDNWLGWLGFILNLALGIMTVVLGVEMIKPSPGEEEEEKARQFRMKCLEDPVDKTTLMLVRNAKSRKAVQKALRECVPAWCEDHAVNAVQLWQMNEHDYVLTFPFGVNGEGLTGVLCWMSDYGEVCAWAKISMIRKFKGEWMMVVTDESGELVAVTDNGNHYITYVTDDDDIRWKPYYVTTLAFENSPGMSILESAKKLDLYF